MPTISSSVKFLNIISTILILFILLIKPAFAYETKVDDFVNSISNKVIELVKNQSFSEEQKKQELTDLFMDSVDTYWMARFVVGSNWHKFSKDEQDLYPNTYKEFLAHSYVNKFKKYTNQKIKILKSTKRNSTKEEYVVQTEIVSQDSNNPAYRVDYFIRRKDNRFKIFDIVAEGISLINTERSDFSSILSRQSPKDLIEILQQKVKDRQSDHLQTIPAQ